MSNFIIKLSNTEKKIIYECLCAAESEEIFPEWEFETLFGVKKQKLSQVRENWPKVNVNEVDVSNLIIGVLNNLLGYPHQGILTKYTLFSTNEIKSTLNKLITLGL